MIRVGIGYDVHPLIEGRSLVVGGVHIPYRLGLAGHSDSDVLAHAVVDALLGAAGLGDIGAHFPDQDVAYKDANSLVFVTQTAKLLRERCWRIGNVDATILAQAPKMAPHTAQVREQLSQALQIEIALVSVKAKSTNGLGFEGRGEGIAAHAVVLIESL